MPNVCGSLAAQAHSMLAQHGFITRIEGEVEDSVVEKQLPNAGDRVPKGSTVVIYTKKNETESLE